jgi:myo-inositol-1(or 4)-monophosphatase
MNTATDSVTTEDLAFLAKATNAAHRAGARLLEMFTTGARPASRADMYDAGRRIEEASLAILRTALTEVRPQARWAGDDEETIALPPGEWWVVDGVEGAVNHVHGLPEWAVNVTLVRDNTPVLTVVFQPVAGLTYTALRGGGAHLNGVPLRVSAKTDLDAAVATASQAGGGPELNRRFADSVAVMMGRALLVRNTIPTTFPLLGIASGQYDLFWQYEPDLPGSAAGALIVAEAGGLATDLRGQPWRPGSPDILVAAPGIHAAALDVLSTVA